MASSDFPSSAAAYHPPRAAAASPSPPPAIADSELQTRITALTGEIQELKSQLSTKPLFSLGKLRLSSSKNDPKTQNIAKLLTEKTTELKVLQTEYTKKQELLAIFNRSSPLEMSALVKAVFDENSSKATEIVKEIPVSAQTVRDIINGAYSLTINGANYCKDEAIEQLKSAVGNELAEKILYLTNQHLVISMVPINSLKCQRNPEIYDQLKSNNYSCDGATHFTPIFSVDTSPSQVSVTVEMKIRVTNRNDDQSVTYLSARLEIPHAEQLPTISSTMQFF